MEVTEITVHAGRTFNHPYGSYSNLRPAVTLRATLNEGDDAETCARELQTSAETLVEDHKRHLLHSIEELEEMNRAQSRIASLREMIQRQQEELDRLRRDWPNLASQLSLGGPGETTPEADDGP